MKDKPAIPLTYQPWIRLVRACFVGMLCALPALLSAQTAWQKALANMPLLTNATVLHETNCVPLMLKSFQSNGVVKALVFMPMATDEFFFFHRARAKIDQPSPTLLDAVTALTNQTDIRAIFHPPFLIMHSRNDKILPKGTGADPASAARLKEIPFLPSFCWFDRDWDYALPLLEKSLKIKMLPGRYTTDSWHFYRHSMAGYGLSGWEVLEAMGLAAETKFVVHTDTIEFSTDERTPPPETQWPVKNP